MSLIHGRRGSRSNQIYTRGFKPPQKGLGRPEVIRSREEGSPAPGGQRRFLGEGQSTAKETEGARALCRGQEAAGEAGRRGPPRALWKPQ